MTSLTQHMYKCMKDNVECDVVLIAGLDDTRINAHKVVLKAYPYFRDSLMSGTTSGSTQLLIDRVRGDILQHAVDHMYEHRNQIDKDNCFDVLDVAFTLKLQSLHNEATQFLRENATFIQSKLVAEEEMLPSCTSVSNMEEETPMLLACISVSNMEEETPVLPACTSMEENATLDELVVAAQEYIYTKLLHEP